MDAGERKGPRQGTKSILSADKLITNWEKIGLFCKRPAYLFETVTKRGEKERATKVEEKERGRSLIH